MLLNVARLINFVNIIQCTWERNQFYGYDSLSLSLSVCLSVSLSVCLCLSLILKDRNRMGGGVCLYIRDTVNFKTPFDLIPEGLEAICVQVHNPKSSPFAIVGCYRPQNSDKFFLESFESVIAKLDAQDREIFILGCLATNPNSHTTHY